MSAGRNVEIEWEEFRIQNNITHKLTWGEKLEHLKNTKPQYKWHNPYKCGLGTFDIQTFVSKVRALINALDDKYHLFSTHNSS